jgi:glyoxylase-like metal-dependent hydrolase (beta-lactamase superfamily II)
MSSESGGAWGGAPVPGVPTTLARGVLRLTAPNPSVMTGPGTNSYLLGEPPTVVVDPGPPLAEHVERLARLADGALRALIVTHRHPDHAPAAALLEALTGAEVLAYAPSPGLEPDRLLADGASLEAGGLTLRAIHTPGHASDHVCVFVEELGLLLSGDHVMQGSTVVVAPPDGDMAAYLASLRKVRDLGERLVAIAPGHGAVIERPLELLDWYVAHRLEREQRVLAALEARGGATLEELLPDAYADVDPALHPVAKGSLWAHLRKLVAEGRAGCDDPDDPAARWRAVSAGQGR